MKYLCILVLNYNNFVDTIETLKNIKKIKTNINKSVIVIDNHSTDNSLEQLKIRKNELNYSIIETGKNGGYAFGNNIGIDYSLKNKFRYTLILNNDIYLTDYSIDKMISEYESDKNIGVVGPIICNYESNIVQSAGAINNLYTGTSHLLHSKMDKFSVNTEFDDPDYLSGSCLLISNINLKKFSKIPENYFLFYEENEWCMSFKRHGLSIRCCDKVVVYHKHSATIKKISGVSDYFMTRSQVIFENRNANIIQKIFFNIYTVLKYLRRIIVNKKNIKYLSYYFDAIIGRNRFNFLIK